ncbi:site-specific integrase [Arundinibacter roseus]|uniref:Site-specific integrase n=1 Tax=Arundinibacter roseus TaxID=2070510 RepID=A0A4R4KC88_9BACT|nr:site-specific integrase [Arundinibacter roseus]TDB64372.1 site-specific integrase [Arundinibacter roseus]
MSNITFHIELDNYVKKDGTQTVQIRITQNKKLKRVGAGFSVLSKDWNPEKEEIRKSDPQYRQKNSILKAKRIELEQAYLKNTVKGRVTTVQTLIKAVKFNLLGDNFFTFAKAHIAALDSPASRAGQTSVVKKLEDYLKNQELPFGEIDHKLLNRYRQHLKGKGNSANTIQSNFSKLRGIYNEAVESGHFTPEGGNPFDMIKLKKQKSSRVKLSIEEIEKIYNLDIRKDINAFHAKNIFLFSFYMQGIRFADVVQLTWSQIRENRYEYVANKTGKVRSIRLHKRASQILEFYSIPGVKPHDYVFPFLKGKEKGRFTQDEWFKIISSTNSIVGKNLKKIASQAGIQHFSMHVARHSFAEIARKETGDIYAVSEALDHSSISVTENYFAAAKREENDAFADKVYGTEEKNEEAKRKI